MAGNKKPRKAYKPMAGAMRAAPGRIGRNVSMLVATNPVAQAVERSTTERAVRHMGTRAFMIEDRAHEPEFLDDCIHTVGLAMLAAAKSWHVDRDAQALLLAAVEALTRMGLDSQRWHAEMAGLVAEAVETAAAILLKISPADRSAGAAEIAALVAVAEQRVRAAA